VGGGLTASPAFRDFECDAPRRGPRLCPCLYRAAREHSHVAGDVAALLVKRLEQADDRGFTDRLVDDDPQSAAR
jgi:hypothetical protein